VCHTALGIDPRECRAVIASEENVHHATVIGAVIVGMPSTPEHISGTSRAAPRTPATGTHRMVSLVELPSGEQPRDVAESRTPGRARRWRISPRNIAMCGAMYTV
jgi:hypothetical protein